MFDSMVGITSKDWLKLASKNHFRFNATYFKDILAISMLSINNSYLLKKETKKYGEKIEQTNLIGDPIFLLGHWRSGTTFLHTLLSQDEQFAYPTLFDIRNPHSLLVRGELLKEKLENVNHQKRAMDNILVSPNSPQEEEFAIAILSGISPLLGWVFPKNSEYYDRFMCFNDADADEISLWKQTLMFYLKKLTLKYNKQLLLKSPTNTGRIKQLLELFPNAKFIHIHRNPYNVFNSTKKLYISAVKNSQLQKPNSPKVDDYIIGRYHALYTSFFKTKKNIPAENFLEIAFEDLENNPLTVLERIYHDLSLKKFDQVKPIFQKFIKANSNYKKNTYTELPLEIREKIADQWKQCFTEWNYKI